MSSDAEAAKERDRLLKPGREAARMLREEQEADRDAASELDRELFTDVPSGTGSAFPEVRPDPTDPLVLALNEKVQRIIDLEAENASLRSRVERLERVAEAAREAWKVLDRGQNDHDPKWPWLGTQTRMLLRDALDLADSQSSKEETR